MASSADHLGHWVWTILRSQLQERVTIAAMYRPNPPTSTGQETAWVQQHTRLTKIYNERGVDPPIDPREKCLQDLQDWIVKQEQQGEKVIALTNANQSTTKRMQAHFRHTMIHDCNLSSATEVLHPGCSPHSNNIGTKTIDHMLKTGIYQYLIHKDGHLPFDVGFDSNH